MQHPQNTLATT